MKKRKTLLVLAAVLAVNGFAKTKGTLTVGSDIVKTDDTEDQNIVFGGAYTNLNITAENEYVTAGGKIYFRLNSTDEWESLAKKIEIKKAFLKARPFGTDLFEIAIGKLYSYYLPGNFFQLSEIYTGSSRWGKTGLGVLINKNGFSGGAALALSESYEAFTDSVGVNGALVYDFKEISSKIPVKLGADLLYLREVEDDDTYSDDFSSTVSILYTPKVDGFISKLSLALSYSYNSEPYVASSVFKNVTNYKNADLKKSNFASVNFSTDIGRVKFTLEGEAGHSKEGSMIPLYAGTQLLIPVFKFIYFKPRFFYYAALDEDDNSASRQTFEVYPRLWLEIKNVAISAGYDFDFKQTSDDEWRYEWAIPFFIEYRLGK